jgi:signal peptide peptidase SppA
MRDCRLEHLGIWLVEDHWFSSAVNAVKAGVLRPEMQADSDSDDEGGVIRGPAGMAIVDIRGHMTKGRSSFGGTSTVALRRSVRALAADDSVSGIMLRIDSPGGTADGTFELAEDVREAAAAKPVRSHIDDLGASAAYYVASQTSRITANAPGEVGSIGAVAVLVDSSAALERDGIKVHVISTGPDKGAGAPGAQITEDQLAMFQERVHDINAFFLEAVGRGRRLGGAELARVSSGRVWVAEKALRLGLIDQVMSWDEAVGDFARELERRPAGVGDRSRTLALAELECELGRR